MTGPCEKKDWAELPDEQILRMRIRDLNVAIPGSPLEPLIKRLYAELDAKGLRFHPPCYLADEWLCPEKMPIIGIPFCLAHPRLKRIEQKMMGEVEGGTEQSCMKLLRHECGHAFNYAYQFYRKTRWRQLFGPFSMKYTNSYYYQPYSRRFVNHLADNYAQAHPDEDFAETFAVWLTPGSRWEQKYQDWPVIKKLRYVDRLMKTVSNMPPIVAPPQHPPWAAQRLSRTLEAHYHKKRTALGSQFQGFYDDSLKEIFTEAVTDNSRYKASKFIRQHRRYLVESIASWTGHRKYDIYQLVNRMILRCRALDLYATDKDIIDLVAFLTAIASNTLRIPKRRRPV